MILSVHGWSINDSNGASHDQMRCAPLMGFLRLMEQRVVLQLLLARSITRLVASATNKQAVKARIVCTLSRFTLSRHWNGTRTTGPPHSTGTLLAS